MRIAQFRTREGDRRVAQVQGEHLLVIEDAASTYELAVQSLASGMTLESWIEDHLGTDRHDYDLVIAEGRIMSPVDHPDPSKCWITGTGLTHLGSAAPRDKMHTQTNDDAGQTDTMRMFEMGIRGGKPSPGEVGVQPEWFYKGNGTCVVAPEAPLPSPSFALMDGDEIEVCAFYIIAPEGIPRRIGFALGNEFADHQTEKMNYLYLAHSKLRPCSFGPELLIGDLPLEVVGTSRILRDGEVIWSKSFQSGEKHMSHHLANLEYHLFKYPLFRTPGDVHGHFLGTATVSFADGIQPQAGDLFELEAPCFGAPLRNTLQKELPERIVVEPLYSRGH